MPRIKATPIQYIVEDRDKLMLDAEEVFSDDSASEYVPSGDETEEDEVMPEAEEESMNDSASEYLPSDDEADEEVDDEADEDVNNEADDELDDEADEALNDEAINDAPQPRLQPGVTIRPRGGTVVDFPRPGAFQPPVLATANSRRNGDSDDDGFIPDVNELEDYRHVSQEAEKLRSESSGTTAQDGTRLQIPDDFPRIILHVLNRIKDQTTRYMGQHILQVIIDFLQNTFTQVVKQDIAAFLALAPDHVQEDLAGTIAAIVYNCFEDLPHSTDLAEVLRARHTYGNGCLFRFLRDLSNERLATVLSRPFTTDILVHMTQHLHFYGYGTGSGGFEIGLEVSECVSNWYILPRSMAEVDAFISSLPIVDPEDIDKDEVCGICRAQFVEDASSSVPDEKPETAVQLSCRHIYGPECLKTLLAPKPEGWEHTLCPLCRADVFPDSRAYRLLRKRALVDGVYVMQRQVD